VPTILESGTAFNVVPGAGSLYCDVRADDLDAVRSVVAAVPAEVGGRRCTRRSCGCGRDGLPGGDGRSRRAGDRRAGAPGGGVARGGASDASHFAGSSATTVDGLGPRGGLAHNAGEFVLRDALRSRAEVALAVTDAVLGAAPG
jgi:glutamate carboxypeptidase